MKGPGLRPSRPPVSLVQAMQTPVPRHRLVQLLLMFLLFLGSSVGSWAWFHVSPQKYPVSYHFHVRQQVAGYEFVPEAVAEEAVEILATTNLFNGRFVREKRDRFTVFAGEWTGRDAREMSVVQHTPDICWVTVGARPVDMGQPSVVEVPLAGEKVAFECRVFNMGHDSIPEMTIWCATATGQVLMEGGRFSGEATSEWEKRKLMNHYTRIRSMNTFLQAVKNRIPGDGSKQFVRLSTGVTGDWRITLAQLKDFAQQWLELEVARQVPST